MKGIVLAGGSGTRLHPITKGISKQLIPIYDKPMVYYPISTLMLAGIREILIISTPQDLPAFKRLLGDGAQLGVSFSYREQPSPDGLAQALIIGEEFVGKEPCCLILGDNIFYGQGFAGSLNEATIRARDEERATIFGCYVTQPERFGVAVFDETGQLKAIEEKPDCPKSHYAVAGLYFYPAGISDLAHQVKPSARGELEITTLNQMLLDQKRLHLHKLGRGFTWLDTGTIDALTEASAFVEAIQKRQGLQIANLEEIAWRQGWLDDETLQTTARQLRNSQYGQYLLSLTSTLE